MRAILQTLPGLIDELSGSEAREAIVFAVWPTVIGEQLSEMSAPIRLEGKVLSIAVTGCEWKREFEQHAAQIVYKINAALKCSVVERLAFVIDAAEVQSSSAMPPSPAKDQISPSSMAPDVSAAAADIKDPELRANFLKAAAVCIERRDSASK